MRAEIKEPRGLCYVKGRIRPEKAVCGKRGEKSQKKQTYDDRRLGEINEEGLPKGSR